MKPIWITPEQALKVHTQLIQYTGGSDGLRELGVLQSAIEGPLQTLFGQDAYPTITEKAVRLGCSIIKFHPFIDGNKRAGAHLMLIILRLNKIRMHYTQDELTDIIMSVASGIADYSQLLEWVNIHKF